MLLYNGSKEKNAMISLHKISENTILVGPTLNTGVDLPGDDCRFIIILKVPYPSMADKLVKEKSGVYRSIEIEVSEEKKKKNVRNGTGRSNKVHTRKSANVPNTNG